MVQQPDGVAWWRSLYLRIGVSFVLLVIAIALIQGLLFTARMQRDSRDPRRSPHAVAMEAALAAAAAMERGEPFDLRRMQRERYPDWALMDIVMSDGTVQSASADSPLPPALLDYARQMLPPTPPEERVAPTVDRPLLTAPIQVDGQLKGLVLLRFPRRSLIGEVGTLPLDQRPAGSHRGHGARFVDHLHAGAAQAVRARGRGRADA